MVDVLYQSQPVLDAVAATLSTGISHTPAGGAATPLRVDVDGVDGQIAAPMALVTEGAGSGYTRPAMTDRTATVDLFVLVTCIGLSLAQARALRGRVIEVLLGGPTAPGSPVTPAGLRVVRRRVEGSLPMPFVAGDWAQAITPIVLTVERAS